MKSITELTDNLEQSFVIVKNGRRNLASAKDSVAGALKVAESHSRKKSLMSALDMLVRVRECQDLEASIRSNLETSSYVDAVCDYAAALGILRTLEGLKCAETLGQDLGSLLGDTVNSVETVLFEVCGDFQPTRYKPLIEAYLLLGEKVKPLGDKVQECFLRAVENQTEGMLRLHSLQHGGVAEADDTAAARKSRMGYKELCQQLSPTQFFPCFSKILEVLFDIFCSHYRMLKWHEAHTRALVEGCGDEKTVQACKAVVAALMRSRRSIVDMAGARIAALLQASSAPSSGHFKAVLDWARAFIEAAEAFSGTQATTLRGHLERAGDRYFESLHSQRLEALQQMIDREVWLGCLKLRHSRRASIFERRHLEGRVSIPKDSVWLLLVGFPKMAVLLKLWSQRGIPFLKAPTPEVSMEIRLPKVARTPQKVASIMLQKTQIMKKTRRMLQSLRHSSMRETMTTTPLTQKCDVHDVKRRAAAAAAEASAAASRDCHVKGLDARSPTLTASLTVSAPGSR